MILLDSRYWEARKTVKKGVGIFLKQDIPACTIIGDYIGILTKNENIPKSLEIPMYGFAYTKSLSVIPLNVNIPGVHTINHACTPNCVVKFYRHHILYITTRKVFAGEELTVDYSLDPPQSTIDKSILYPCFCGSLFCRGAMNIAPRDFDQENTWLKKLHGQGVYNIYREGMVIERLGSYPTKLPLGSEYDVYANQDHSIHFTKLAALPKQSELRKTLRDCGSVLTYNQIGIAIYGLSGSIIMGKILGSH